MTLGIISMRNEDGTQWLENVEGKFYWTDHFQDATPVPEMVMDVIKSQTEEINKNDCPDNGFFGVYKLEFSEVKK